MPYTSRGTISVVHKRTVDTDCEYRFFFVPHSDYSVKHRNKNYAIFVLESNCIDIVIPHAAIIRKYNIEEDRKVQISVEKNDFQNMLSAAMQQTKVEIEVEEISKKGDGTDLCLVSITIPAK